MTPLRNLIPAVLFATGAALHISCSGDSGYPAPDAGVVDNGGIDAAAAFEAAAAHARNAIDAAPRRYRFPHSVYGSGRTKYAFRKEWTSGFFPGILWYLYEYTGDPAWEAEARRWTERVDGVQYLENTHDLGFMIYCSYGNGYRLTGDERYRETIVQAAESLLTRFNPYVGLIRSWSHGYWGLPWRFPVIVDNLMNLELLYFAANATGDVSISELATSHARITMRDFIRDDFSSYHVIDYDPFTGDIRRRMTHQGFATDSAWARGQAWALYGFTMAWRETGDYAFLDLARGIADFILSHPATPPDGIPYWDFDDPGIPNAPRDASAGAIIASALLELQEYIPEKRDPYIAHAERILRSLSSPAYLAPPGTNNNFLLKHSTGNFPGSTEIDKPLIYADYYFLEALLRWEASAKETPRHPS